MKLKELSEVDYTNVPGVKVAFKHLVLSLLRKIYLSPKQKAERLLNYLNDRYFYKRNITKSKINKNGIKGLFLVLSYTDFDKNYIPGLLKSGEVFERVVFYHDKNKNPSFKFNESVRFQQLINEAKRSGASWVLIGSPKTRFSKEFKGQIAPLLNKYNNTQTVFSLKERYLWRDFDHYVQIRTDNKEVRVNKLFAITDDMVFDNKPIHALQHPVNYTNIVKLSASRYYLGRFNMNTIRQKANFYGKIDGGDYSFMEKMLTLPKRHNEHILGISSFEKEQLLER